MTRFALVLSGGASLGAYVAGAVSEILRALETNRADGEARVHVLAGSSAGALTAAVAARALAVNPTALPWLERAWVEAMDAEVLLEADRRNRAGLLDVGPVEELARALVTADPAADDRPARAAGRPLRVGVTLSNLHGVPFRLRHRFLNAPDRHYGLRSHRDWAEFELTPGGDPRDPAWTELREAALASAAFPLAFPPRALERDPGLYAGAAWPEGLEAPVRMWYADGGLFDNRPVGLARRLVERFPDHREAEWRYVVVDPYLEAGGAGTDASRPAPASAARAAEAVTRALLGQAAARDWHEAQKVNTRLEILEALVSRLPEIGDRLCDPEAVGIGLHVGRLAEEVAEMKVAVSRGAEEGAGDPVLDYLERNLARIQAEARFAAAFEGVDTRAARTRVAKLIFVLEAAGGLRDKEPLALHLVAPPEGERLCGAFLGNFGGFLHRPWRASDFRAGRRDARRLLESHLSDVVAYEPAAPEAYEVLEAPSAWSALPDAARRRVERFVEAEADRTLEALRPGFLGRLLGPVWRPAARRWARRRALEALRGAAG